MTKNLKLTLLIVAVLSVPFYLALGWGIANHTTRAGDAALLIAPAVYIGSLLMLATMQLRRETPGLDKYRLQSLYFFGATVVSIALALAWMIFIQPKAHHPLAAIFVLTITLLCSVVGYLRSRSKIKGYSKERIFK